MSNSEMQQESGAPPERVSPVRITGATGGLGFEAALELASYGDSLILAVRNAQRGHDVAEKIRDQYPTVKVDVCKVDVASLSSVADFAEHLIDIGLLPKTIICNAGVQIVDGVQVSDDGFEMTMATNVLGHVALLARLIPHLQPGSRIMTLGSETHRGGPRAFGFPAAQWTDMSALLNPSRGTKTTSKAGRVRYSTSKLACIALAYEIDQRFRERDIRAVSFDPGLMPDTGLVRGYPEAIKKLYAKLVPFLIRLPGANGVAKSGENLAWLVHHGDAENLMGKYISDRRSHKSSNLSYTPGLGEEVWSSCCRAAGINPNGG